MSRGALLLFSARPVPSRVNRSQALANGSGNLATESDNPMNRSARVLVVLAALFAMLASTGCSKLQARDQLNKGVQAYKNARYEEAIEHFKNAVDKDPSLTNARLYLATAYAQQYVPGMVTPENERNATMAIQEFQKILDANPNREQQIHSLKGIASLYFNMKNFDQAVEYHRKVIALDPNDPETYYSIAVIDWTQAYQEDQKARAGAGIQATAQIKDKKICQALRDKNAQKVEDGITDLQKAIQIRPDYDDAMAYINLLYRQRAEYECDDQAAYDADIKTANEWVDKTIATKKAKAEKAGPTGVITTDQPK
jgi:tetratricopeptide (TPR) repeat protein